MAAQVDGFAVTTVLQSPCLPQHEDPLEVLDDHGRAPVCFAVVQDHCTTILVLLKPLPTFSVSRLKYCSCGSSAAWDITWMSFAFHIILSTRLAPFFQHRNIGLGPA